MSGAFDPPPIRRSLSPSDIAAANSPITLSEETPLFQRELPTLSVGEPTASGITNTAMDSDQAEASEQLQSTTLASSHSTVLTSSNPEVIDLVSPEPSQEDISSDTSLEDSNNNNSNDNNDSNNNNDNNNNLSSLVNILASALKTLTPPPKTDDSSILTKHRLTTDLAKELINGVYGKNKYEGQNNIVKFSDFYDFVSRKYQKYSPLIEGKKFTSADYFNEIITNTMTGRVADTLHAMSVNQPNKYEILVKNPTTFLTQVARLSILPAEANSIFDKASSIPGRNVPTLKLFNMLKKLQVVCGISTTSLFMEITIC